jgi:hypothetical protein
MQLGTYRRQTLIQELRQQLQHSQPGAEQEAIRDQLNFWLNYTPYR